MPVGQFTVAQWRKLTGWLNDGVLPRHILTKGDAPTLTGGSALGGGVAGLVGSATDISGAIVCSIGTAPVGGVLVTVNFAQGYPTAPTVLVNQYDSNQNLIMYPLAATASGFQVAVGNAAGTSTSLRINYHVIGS